MPLKLMTRTQPVTLAASGVYDLHDPGMAPSLTSATMEVTGLSALIASFETLSSSSSIGAVSSVVPNSRNEVYSPNPHEGISTPHF